MDEDKRKHLDYIQAIITRMNTNSFQIKNMTVVILAAIFALFVATPKVMLLFFIVLPLITFCLLDSYYLQQERKFREMYKDVAGLTNNYELKPYEMPLNKYKGNRCSYGENVFSKTIMLFYLPLLIIVITIALICMIFLQIPIM